MSRAGGWLAMAALAAALTTPSRAQAQDEVPFVTTPDRVTLAMLELARVGRDDFVIDLGSGDGRIVNTAALRLGARGLGVDIVPALVEKSRALARAAGVQDRATFREQDLFETDLRPATVVTMYLLPEVNLQLRPRLLALAAGTRIVSHDFDMGDWIPDRSLRIDVPDKAVGSERFSRVHLWVVPARLQGLWCSSTRSLQIEQRFQQASGTLLGTGPAPRAVFDARIEGTLLRPVDPRAPTLRLAGDRLEVQEPGSAAELADQVFVRGEGPRCQENR